MPTDPIKSLFRAISHHFWPFLTPDCAPYSASKCTQDPHMNLNCELGEESAKNGPQLLFLFSFFFHLDYFQLFWPTRRVF